MKDVFEKDLVDLKQQQTQAIAHLNAISGAIQYIEVKLKDLGPATPATDSTTQPVTE